MTETVLLYNFPAMLELVAELESQSASIESLGASIQAQQKFLAGDWEGSAAESYQNWQEQWNINTEELAESLRSIAATLAINTTAMSTLEIQQALVWSGI